MEIFGPLESLKKSKASALLFKYILLIFIFLISQNKL
jgi:hypothetical protein